MQKAAPSGYEIGAVPHVFFIRLDILEVRSFIGIYTPRCFDPKYVNFLVTYLILIIEERP